MNDQNNSNNKLPSFLTSCLALKIAGGVIAVLLVIAIALGLRNVISSKNKATKLGFEDIGQLATQSAYCTEVNVTESSRNLWGITIPFTQSKYIYSYDVVINAGFDFGEIQWSANEDKKEIEVKLPPARVLSSSIDLDSFQVYHESESLFRQITLEENNEALTQLKKSAEENAVANGLLENARRNAETILTGYFANQYDLEEYKIIFKDK